MQEIRNAVPSRIEDMSTDFDELRKDKRLATACPGIDLANMTLTCSLVSKEFNAEYLQGGLLGLLVQLKGERIKSPDLS